MSEVNPQTVEDINSLSEHNYTFYRLASAAARISNHESVEAEQSIESGLIFGAISVVEVRERIARLRDAIQSEERNSAHAESYLAQGKALFKQNEALFYAAAIEEDALRSV